MCGSRRVWDGEVCGAGAQLVYSHGAVNSSVAAASLGDPGACSLELKVTALRRVLISHVQSIHL